MSATFSGPAAAIGNDMRDAFELALDQMGRKMGGKPVSVIYEDDQQKPEIGKQRTDKLIEGDRVNFLTGYIWSNVLLASLKSAVDAQHLHHQRQRRTLADRRRAMHAVVLLHLLAGRPGAAGGRRIHEQQGREVGLPDRAELRRRQGRDRGAEGQYKGNVVGEEYTRWPDQLDFSAELAKARAAKPDAIFAFYPGGAGIQFMTQYTQAGLKQQIPLYTSFIIDAVSLPRLKDLAVGVPSVQHWVSDLPNEANKTFVSEFQAKYRRTPAFYAAQAYDAANLIASAVAAVDGDVSKKDAMRAEMKKANYASVRGPYKYGNNHFPIQNFYLQEAVAGPDGTYALKTIATATSNHQDRYHDRCPMK